MLTWPEIDKYQTTLIFGPCQEPIPVKDPVNHLWWKHAGGLVEEAACALRTMMCRRLEDVSVVRKMAEVQVDSSDWVDKLLCKWSKAAAAAVVVTSNPGYDITIPNCRPTQF